MAVDAAIIKSSLPCCKKEQKKGRDKPGLSSMHIAYLLCQVIRHSNTSSQSVTLGKVPAMIIVLLLSNKPFIVFDLHLQK
jgi:hypothetical protein